MKLYLIGSLRNPDVPLVSATLRTFGHQVHDDWYAAGPRADDHWQEYEKDRGKTLSEALRTPAAQNVFHFDKQYLDWCDAAVLLMPCGKSGHLELGYAIGTGKRGYVLMLEEPDRWDVMYAFTDGLFTDIYDLAEELSSGN